MKDSVKEKVRHLMDCWSMEVGQVEYAGDKQISLQLWNSMQEF